MLGFFVYRQNAYKFISFGMYNAKQINALIGRNLKRLRVRAGLTQEKLGEMIGVNGVVIAQIESGIRGMGKDLMARLCNVLKVEPVEFFIDDTTPIPASELEKKALFTVREAEKLGIRYIAEESTEYLSHRLSIVKKQTPEDLRKSKTSRVKGGSI